MTFIKTLRLAQQNLNNVTLYGQEMRVSRSKHDNVNMPKAEDEGKELTKDYANSPLHRFKVSQRILKLCCCIIKTMKHLLLQSWTLN